MMPSSTNQLGRTRIKICGVTSVESALVAAEAGADAVGLVRIPDSPRYVDADLATDIVLALPPFVNAVGVYRNNYPTIRRNHDAWEDEPSLDGVQLHGDEDEDFCEKVIGDVIRAVPFDPRALQRWDRCDDVDALLVERGVPGTGHAWDYAELARMKKPLSKRIILAGGLNPENVAEAIRAVRPFAVDVSSGVESSRGVKDPRLIRAFCDAVHRADAELSG
jgi:phosphoribosylanthranilate isomerase